MSAQYRFLSFVRQAAAAGIATPDTFGANQPGRTLVPIHLRVNDRHDVDLQMRLYGPGEVTGIDRAEVVRTEPKHLTKDFSPNYFPAIEFDRPDFPWLFTPAKHNTFDRPAPRSGKSEGVRPWLCLIVVRKQEGVALRSNPKQPLPVLEIKPPAKPVDELPDLAESWAWAHAQVSGDFSGAVASGQLLTNSDPTLTLSRLLCPRKLEPQTDYYACVVPTFELGVKAGLGLPIQTSDETQLKPAWNAGAQAPNEITLPIYFHWEFRTGEPGDFETLVRLLQPRPVAGNVGYRDMDVKNLGYGLPDAGALLGLEGALRAPQTQPTAWPNAAPFENKLTEVLNAPDTLATPEQTPIVAPPIYGCWHAAQRTIRTSGTPLPKLWLRQLNLDPRMRAAANFGTLVIQKEQEQLIASAWEQAGELKRANQILRQTQLARAASSALLVKHFARMPERTLFRATAPALSRMRIAPQTSFRQFIANSNVPVSNVTAAFRRVDRANSPLTKRLAVMNPGVVVARATTLKSRVTFLARKRPAPLDKVTLNKILMKVQQAEPAFATTVALGSEIQTRLTGLLGLILFGRLEQRRGPFGIPIPFQTSIGFTIMPENSPVLPPQKIELPGTEAQKAARNTAGAFRQAAEQHIHQNHFAKLLDVQPPALKANFLFTAANRTNFLASLHPEHTIAMQMRSRLQAHEQPLPPSDPEEPLEPIMAHPEFPHPMSQALCGLSQELLLPGLESIPANTITLLETNPRFIAAFMTGLNHEMSRELLWREYPTDQRGTYFRRFWDTGDRDDVPAVHAWSATKALGDDLALPGGKSLLVLLIRGELLRRYPNTIIYATRAKRKSRSGPRVPSFETSDELYPLFTGTLQPDVSFLGFDLTAERALGKSVLPNERDGWFFVIQQQPTEPRFGFDTAEKFAGELQKPAQWNELSWGHLAHDEAAFKALTHARVNATLPDTSAIATAQPLGMQVSWGKSAAHMAYITLQQPVRIAIHAESMIP